METIHQKDITIVKMCEPNTRTSISFKNTLHIKVQKYPDTKLWAIPIPHSHQEIEHPH